MDEGCRTDNGRCFAFLSYDEEILTMTMLFTDGSQYTAFPVSQDEFDDHYATAIQPGCHWNKVLKLDPSILLTKINGPTQ